MAAYAGDADGFLRPAVPSVCPFADGSGEACRVFVDHFRPRATGPCFPVMVPRCRVHGHAFTVYPPGHTPYGRQPLIEIARDGSDISGGPPPPVADGEEPAQAPDLTRLGDARRASRGQAGVRFAMGGSDFWWGTQRRRIAFAVDLCGVDPVLTDDARLARSLALGVSLQLLKDAAAAIQEAPGYRSRGKAVVAVLCAMADVDSGKTALGRLRYLLAAGHLAGLWGPPYWWDRGTRQLRRWAFPAAGTRPP